LHVNDVSSALKLILDNGKIGDIYNIGSDDKDEYTILQIAQMLIYKILNTKEYDKWIKYIDDSPFNDKRYYISNEKVKQLGWEIKTDFNNGINELINTLR
jgi:UDP-glucose 4,6-dehydratase